MEATQSSRSEGATREVCLHCGSALQSGAASRSGAGQRGASDFCCAGCARVHAILGSAGLDRYYDLRGDDGVPVSASHEGRDHKWLEPIEAQLQSSSGLERVAVDVQGVHCSACVWLIGELFEREAHGGACVVNPTRGRIELTVDREFDLRRWIAAVESVGYLVGPPLKEVDRRADELTIRMGISLALAANTMMLSLAIYFGLAEGPFHTLAREVSFALSAATVVVGGGVFVRSAWQSLRARLLHLDLPIAVGIVLAFVGSSWSFFRGGGADYFDTLAVFVALMLVGRWIQERAVRRNRDQLLRSDGVEGLFTRRVTDGRVDLVRCVDLREGDTLLLAPGDLVPVDAQLESPARLRLDWINGEAEPRAYASSDLAPAGAFHASGEAVRAIARTDFQSSPLIELLATPRHDAHPEGGREHAGDAPRFWDRLAKLYVIGVLAAGAGAFALWLGLDGLPRALGVATAVLVVTCPCAFGIAAPLAHELVQAHLRRGGLFVRNATLLSRAPAVRRVVFDKTGTLTTGAPRVVDRSPLAALDETERGLLYELAARSNHPKSAAVVDALGAGTLSEELSVHEEPSAGLQAQHEGHLYRLGRPGWAAPNARSAPDVDLVFARDGRCLAALATEEELRADAEDELRRLEALGYETWILSGDASAKVAAIARALGVPEERALGDKSPREKAEWLRTHGAERALFIGDGINDGLAAEVALASGTPAVDRPFMPARSDFYFVTPGLAPIRRMLEASRRLERVVRADLVFALAYNVFAVGLAYAGLVEPWVAAVLMPLSSVATIGATTFALARRSAWRS